MALSDDVISDLDHSQDMIVLFIVITITIMIITVDSNYLELCYV